MTRRAVRDRTYPTEPVTAGSHPGGRRRLRPIPDSPFSRWLADQPDQTQDVADALGITPVYLYKLRDGTRRPGRALALKIADHTDGAVPVESWDQGKD